MAKTTKDAKSTRKRTKVKDLPKPEQELNEKEMKKVKGGIKVYSCPSRRSTEPIKIYTCPSDSSAPKGGVE